MFNRLLHIDHDSPSSAFIFGPRGTGKTYWLKHHFPEALYFDLLDADLYTELLARPTRLHDRIPNNYRGWVIIDEVQKIPELLNEVHRLIEHRQIRFILTGSSARSLRRRGVNLLAGRALIYHMHPLTALELGDAYNLSRSLQWGQLPVAITHPQPESYLSSYVQTYLHEEVLFEGLTRNLGAFTRFLEAASFSQVEILNYTDIAREAANNRHTVNNYFDILEDLLIAYRIPVFTKRAKRDVITHPKFYFFDVGIFRTIRPMGILDSIAEAEGPSLETLFLQEMKAINDYFSLGYSIYYWRTRTKLEVDFILYGNHGLYAIEIKRTQRPTLKDFRGLKAFQADYPEATCYLLYGGTEDYYESGIKVRGFEQAMKCLPELFK